MSADQIEMERSRIESTLFCNRPACPGITREVGRSLQFAPAFRDRVIEDHLAIHQTMADIGPAPRCPEHAPLRRRPTGCARHLKVLADLVDALRNLGCLEEQQIWRYLNGLAFDLRIVEYAAESGTRSERRRAAMRKKPRKGSPPRGWRLALEILQRYDLPREYLPKTRRDAIRIRGHQAPYRRVDASILLQNKAHDAERAAWNEYHQSYLPAFKAYLATLTTTMDNARIAGETGGFDSTSKLGRETVRLRQAYEKSKRDAEPLHQKAIQDSADYRTLLIRRKVVTGGGGRLTLPRTAMSHFWTAAERKLRDLYWPYVRKWKKAYRQPFLSGRTKDELERLAQTKDEMLHLYSTPTRLIRLSLAVLAPSYHLHTTNLDLRDRLRNS